MVVTDAVESKKNVAIDEHQAKMAPDMTRGVTKQTVEFESMKTFIFLSVEEQRLNTKLLHTSR